MKPLRKQISKAKYERALKFNTTCSKLSPTYNFRVIYELDEKEYPTIVVNHAPFKDDGEYCTWGYWSHPVTGKCYRFEIVFGRYKSNYGKSAIYDPWNSTVS